MSKPPSLPDRQVQDLDELIARIREGAQNRDEQRPTSFLSANAFPARSEIEELESKEQALAEAFEDARRYLVRERRVREPLRAELRSWLESEGLSSAPADGGSTRDSLKLGLEFLAGRVDPSPSRSRMRGGRSRVRRWLVALIERVMRPFLKRQETVNRAVVLSFLDLLDSVEQAELDRLRSRLAGTTQHLAVREVELLAEELALRQEMAGASLEDLVESVTELSTTVTGLIAKLEVRADAADSQSR